MRAAFANFTLDSATREVRRDGQAVHLSPKAFDVLQLLIERRPAVVTKAHIFEQVWQQTFVQEANLNVVVAEIRRALADDAKTPRFVRTSHGQGYAFSGTVADLTRGISSAATGPACWLEWNEQTFPLTDGENLVGRDPRCAVWLDASGVSRRHARICVTGDAVTLEDLDSRNGTFLGSHRLTSSHALADGEIVELGSATITFRMWSDASSPETERMPRDRG
ncbi:MAG: winged helix-turn-helix domain-containing protein [Acidobacteriota bacterium]